MTGGKKMGWHGKDWYLPQQETNRLTWSYPVEVLATYLRGTLLVGKEGTLVI